MQKRQFLQDSDPQAFRTMLAFEQYLAASPLSPIHAELIKIRVSQLNGCSFCIDKHTRDALKYGESMQRILLLPCWRETDLFDEQEQAILSLAESVTNISVKGVPDEIYQPAHALLGEKYFTAVLMGIIAMNAWNRVGITTGRMPAQSPLYDGNNL
ncbi:hypothetical protein C7T94_18920 [Pedobacter yulinensis]|uniref:Carboxymuconolactone decarboxylase-like domain-containing protein n=1 Tax=Pedobacter yulinensis TaxID=2126353 RepID=A0A2T3HGX4_9SPHI|nr:carboxymuconolactone decarboxylase family protein [Pedobacter yulinensis]PST81687.1 hypothetical protein C7T94_18920 [Pedobacter yulinensis]